MNTDPIPWGVTVKQWGVFKKLLPELSSDIYTYWLQAEMHKSTRNLNSVILNILSYTHIYMHAYMYVVFQKHF